MKLESDVSRPSFRVGVGAKHHVVLESTPPTKSSGCTNKCNIMQLLVQFRLVEVQQPCVGNSHELCLA